MIDAIKAPSGRTIWHAVRDELMLNLYPLPYSTLAPTVYHVYLHPDDFTTVEHVVSRIVAQIQRALSAEVDKVNRGLERSSRRMLNRLLEREDHGPIEVPPGGWQIHIVADRNGELKRGQLGIVSTLALAAPAEYGGTPTTRIVKSVVGGGRRTSTTEIKQTATDVQSAPTGAQDSIDRARLTYEDQDGPHVFVMRKDTLSIGRGGSAAWVDVQVIAPPKVSREHCRVRYADGRFFIQDVSLWGTTVNGQALPAAVKTNEGVVQPGTEQELPPSARIVLADTIVMQFEARR
jgi:hypothetical protein